MAALEGGAIANPDENRMVGHYWLRAPELAPTPEIAAAIRDTRARILDFAGACTTGGSPRREAAASGTCWSIGIGGSALGPQFVADALAGPADQLQPHFLDNTDPDGIDRVLAGLGSDLAATLAVVISKSGGTTETRNGMLEARPPTSARGLAFGPHAVAVTGDGSELDRHAAEQGLLERFPMWDWVGGRTSVTSAVGLLPAALQGIDVGALLAGARAMDEVTRRPDARREPGGAARARLAPRRRAAAGAKDMVVLPYKDRLLLFCRYLQQLVMESLGKELDLEGKRRPPGPRGLRQQGLDRPARLRAAAARRARRTSSLTFIECCASATARRASRSSRASPRGDYLHGLPARHAPGAARERPRRR